MDIGKIQQSLAEIGADGWLLYDFHNRDPIAYRVTGMDFGKFTSRRWFYWIPSKGEPVRLAHRVEPTKLDSLPGKLMHYLSWKELHECLKGILGSSKKVAMQYSPTANIPYVSTVDGGTIDLIRSVGCEVVSSADLVQEFESLLDEDGFKSHVEAGNRIQKIKDAAFEEIGRSLKAGSDLTEYDLQQFIVRGFEENGLDCMSEYPIVGIDDHPADPHFEPQPEGSYAFKPGSMILIDLWAKLKKPGAIFYDITWCGFVGENPPEKYVEIWNTVRDARKAAVDFVRKRFADRTPVYGWEVDDACRNVVKEAGWGDYFIHRTGHSIGEEVHGNGVNIDNLETRDERLLVPGICFSIEPGIYLKNEMAVRSEIDVFITPSGEVKVIGAQQEDLILI